MKKVKREDLVITDFLSYEMLNHEVIISRKCV